MLRYPFVCLACGRPLKEHATAKLQLPLVGGSHLIRWSDAASILFPFCPRVGTALPCYWLRGCQLDDVLYAVSALVCCLSVDSDFGYERISLIRSGHWPVQLAWPQPSVDILSSGSVRIASCSQRVSLIVIPFCLSVCLDVCRSFATYSLPRLIDHN